MMIGWNMAKKRLILSLGLILSLFHSRNPFAISKRKEEHIPIWMAEAYTSWRKYQLMEHRKKYFKRMIFVLLIFLLSILLSMLIHPAFGFGCLVLADLTSVKLDDGFNNYPARRFICRDSVARLFVVFRKNDGTYDNIRVSISTDNGLNWSESWVSAESYDQDLPSITVDDNDKLHVVWHGKTSSATSTDNIRYASSTDQGNNWSSPTEITTGNTYFQNNATIAVDSSDDLHVVWHGLTVGYPANTQIRYKKYDSSASSWGSITEITAQSYNSLSPAISVNSDDDIRLVYYGKDSTYTGAYNIISVESTDGGANWSSIDYITTGSDYDQYHPSIAFDSENDAHVVWHGNTSTYTSVYQVRYSKYDDSTDSWSSAVELTTDATYDSIYPSVAVDYGDNIDVVWTHDNVSAYDTIVGTTSTNGGTSWTSLVTYISSSQNNISPSLLWHGHPNFEGICKSGNFCFVYVDETNDDVEWAKSSSYDNSVPIIHSLTAEDLEMGAVTLGTPTLTTPHFLTSEDLTMGAVELGSPSLSSWAEYVFYSQKSGNYKGDTTVWNTARNGSGSAGDPDNTDVRVIQNGHTITSQDNHIGSAIIIESGGEWDRNDTYLQQKGGILNFGTISNSTKKVAIIGPGRFVGLSDDFFADAEISEGIDGQIFLMNGQAIDQNRPLLVEGTMDVVDCGLEFSTNENLQVDDDAVLDFGSGDFAVLSRVKFNSSPGSGYIWSKLTTDEATGCYLKYDGTNLIFGVKHSSGTGDYKITYAFTPTADRMYHILCLRDSTSAGNPIRLYIDGENVSSVSEGVVGNIDNAINFWVGSFYDGSYYAFDGEVYEIIAWKGRTFNEYNAYQQVAKNDINTVGLSLWLKMNEGTGNPADSSGNDLTVSQNGTWIDPEEVRINHKIIVNPNGDLTLGNGIAKDVIYHGNLTVNSNSLFEFSGKSGGIGILTGPLRHTSYHSTAQEIAITEDDISDMNISKIILDREINSATKLDLMMEDSGTVQNYLIGQDYATLTLNSRKKFEGKLWRNSPKQGGMTQLSFFDVLYDLKKTSIYRTFFGSHHSRTIATVTKGTPNEISMSGLYTTDWKSPLLDVVFLRTRMRNLDIELEYGLDYGKIIFGQEGGVGSKTDKYASVLIESDRDPGYLLRFAVYVGDLVDDDTNDTCSGLEWYIVDMVEDSPNYDTAITSGVILKTDIPDANPPFTTADWAVISITSKIKCPRRFKLVLGIPDETILVTEDVYASWHCRPEPFNSPFSAKEGTAGYEEDDLTFFKDTYDSGGSDESIMGIKPGYEIECTNDWDDVRDPSNFIYGDLTKVEMDEDQPSPDWSNKTRYLTSTTWDIAKVSMFHDGLTVTELVERIWNYYGRWWFNKHDISISTDKIPYYIAQNTSVGELLDRLLRTYNSEMMVEYSGSDIVFKAQNLADATTWAGYTDDQKYRRILISGHDLEKFPSLKRKLTERLLDGTFSSSKEDYSAQTMIDGDNNQKPIFTDYTESEPYYPIVTRQPGDVETSMEQASGLIDEIKENVPDGNVSIVDIPMEDSDVFDDTHELLKLVDTRHGWSKLVRAYRIKLMYEDKTWKLMANVEESENLRNMDSKLKSWGEDIFSNSKSEKTSIDSSLAPTGSNFTSSNKFVMVVEVSDTTYSNTSTDQWWIMAGSNNANPTLKRMATNNSSEQLIAPAERIAVNGKVYVYAILTREHLIGLWDDSFDIMEIGAVHQVSKPSSFYNFLVNTRVVLWTPSTASDGYVADLISTDEQYRPPVPFLYHSEVHVTFGHNS